MLAMTSFSTTQNGRPIPILVYHQIAEAPAKGSPFRSLYVSPAAFARQMAWLARLGYTGLSMAGLMPYLEGKKMAKVVGITFDDGYLNNLEHALPVLQKHQFSSTCYAVSQRLGQTNVWDFELGIAQTALMNADQIRQWVAGGQDMGSHTRHHASLPALPLDAAALEIGGSKAELEHVLQCPVYHFCYPYGHYDATHAAMARSSGYATATTTGRGRCLRGANPMELPRVPVVRSTSLIQFWLKVASGYEDRRRV